jgi:hypothetical protein
MSTVEVTMYSLVCDGCGVDANEGTDFAAYVQEFASREIADDQGWLTTFENGKDWCPDCIEWNEDETEQRPKGERPMVSTRRKAKSGTVHEMANLGVDYLCGRYASEPFKWTDDPVTCKQCLAHD